MNIKSLKIFCDVVDRRSFSQAADDNGISQSSVSSLVQQLEERLGVQLLDRSKRPFCLTPEGDFYYDGCQQLVRQYAALEEGVRTLRDAEARRLTVAAIYSIALHHLNELWPRFVESHPRAQAKLEHLRPQEVYEAVENDQAELGIVSFPESSDTLKVVPWYEEPMVAVFHPDSPLAGCLSVGAEHLADYPFIAFNRDLGLRPAIDRFFKKQQCRPRIDHEFDNVENIKKDIEHNAGVSILPERTVREEITRGSLAMAPLSGEPLTRPLAFIHRRDRPLSPLAEQFIQLLTGEAEKLRAQTQASQHR